jgi:hypothetical protein
LRVATPASIRSITARCRIDEILADLTAR